MKQQMKAKIVLLVMLLGLLHGGPSVEATTKQAKFVYQTQLGVASFVANDPPCLDINNPSLQPGDKLWLVSDELPQRTASAEVVKRLTGNCSVRAAGDSPTESHYEIKLTKGQMEFPTLAVAIIKPQATFTIAKGQVSTDLDGDGRTEFFRSCTSHEGIHLTVWTGQPLRGQRRWHYYYYLGYDVEPNCRDAEARG